MGALAIDVHGLTKRFGKKTAVNAIDISVPAGEVWGFLGPNGSGKTTTIRMLCGLLHPDAGEGKCLGYDFRTQSEQIKREVGYMTQKFSFWEDLSIRENLDFVARVYELPQPREVAAAAIERLGLTQRQDQLASDLSGGWKQRLALAACMLHSPKLLLLDEPTAGVDPKARRDFWDEIHRLSSEGLTVLVSTHYMDEAERCGRVGYIYLSKLIAHGTPDELKLIPEVSPPGTRRIEVYTLHTPAALATLRHKPYVLGATIFGQSIHLLMQDTTTLEQVQADLAREGFNEVEIRPILPSLEDVFVTLTHALKE